MQAGAKLVALAVVLAFASGIAVASMLVHGPLAQSTVAEAAGQHHHDAGIH